MSTTPQPIGNMSLIGRTKKVLPTKLGFIMSTEMENKKRDTLERMSPYMALSREGRLKNRGRPWPRERPLKKVVTFKVPEILVYD